MAQGRVGIGRGDREHAVYVVDEEQELAPVGVVGELVIGGAGLAHGYLKRGEQTAERFVPDVFSGVSGARGCTGPETWCATGQMASWSIWGESTNR